MTYENIRFHQRHLVVQDGYFYLLDYTNRILSQKSSAGATTFQYPVDLPSSFTIYTVGDILCLQYDGYNFLSLQKFTSGTGYVIRCWNIINFTCVMVNQFPLTDISGYLKYDINTISVEYYNTKLTVDAYDGDLVISMDEYVEFATVSGTIIGLGFNKFDQRELVTVSGVEGQNIYLKAPLVNNYLAGDPVNIISSIYVFNNYSSYLSDNTGALITLNPYTGMEMGRFTDVEYKNISASKFYRLQGVLQDFPDVFTLAYVKGTNLKLRDLRDLYRYNADVRGSDSFIAVDNSLPDETKWTVPLGDPKILNNSLYFSTTGNGHDRVESTYLLLNDFEVQVSGTLWGVTTFSGVDLKQYNHYMGLDFQTSKTNVEIGLRYSTDFNSNVSTNNLVLYYPFNGSFTDYSGNNFPYNTVIAPTYIDGMDTTASGAASFIATTSVNITSTPLLEVGKDGADFSMVFWIKLIGGFDTAQHTIIQKSAGSFRSPYIWFSNDVNVLKFGVTTTVNATQIVSVTTPINSWVHIAFIKKDNTLYVYYDKVLKGSLVLNGTTTSNPLAALYFGTSPQYPGRNFALDNFMLYGRALTYYEISNFYDKDSDYFSALNGSTVLGVTINGSLTQYNTVASGIDGLSYKFKAIKTPNSLQLSYLTSISGVDSAWFNFNPITIYTQECLLSLGMTSSLTTISGAYFNDLAFYSGYLRYPVDSSIYYGTMAMDNVRNNQSTIITVYDIDIDGDNLYRLQMEASYYGTDYTWATYNYQISPIRSFIDFISVDASTHILPATGRNTAVITSIVFDQYGQGVVNRPVSFTDDDPIGFVTSKTVYTDIFYNTGRADTGYTSGTALRVVEIEATVTQVD